jgi:serine/threonine protein phosphatase 1
MTQKTAYFIIGDIHGMHAQLTELLETSYGKRYRNMERCILVFLGDYVDRGPQSAQVVKTIRELQAKVGKSQKWLDVIALRGNHEQMMVDACTTSDPQDHFFWTRNGGRETMNSYGVQNTWDVPKEDVEWMAKLPTRHINHDHKVIFVHAGFFPSQYPEFSDDVAMWTRTEMFMRSEDEHTHMTGWDNPLLEGYTVFHGHTPQNYDKGQRPYHDKRRVNLDTGACFGGNLSMAIFRPYMDEERNRLQFHQVPWVDPVSIESYK